VVHAELVRAARPDRCSAETGAEGTRAIVVAAELVIDPRDARAGGTPTPIGLQLGGGRNDERERSTVFRVRVVGVPVCKLRPTQRMQVRCFGLSRGNHERYRHSRSDAQAVEFVNHDFAPREG